MRSLLLLAALAFAPVSAQSLVADVRPGPASSDPLLVGEAGGRLVFSATDGRSRGVYATDGTTTTRLATANARAFQSVRFRGSLYFLTFERDGGDLWRTDGTPAGTARVANLPPSEGGRYITATRDRLFFLLGSVGTATELWTSDGTETGTRRVEGARPRINDGARYVVTATDDRVLFSSDGGYALSASDGTNVSVVSDFGPSPRTGGGGFFYGAAIGDGERAFASVIESQQAGLYAVDGADVRFVGHYNVGSSNLSLTPFGPGVLFGTNEAGGTVAFRISDGTAEGTRRVTPDLKLQVDLRTPDSVTLTGGNAYVPAVEGGALALWQIAPDGASSVALRLPPDESLMFSPYYFDTASENRPAQVVALADGLLHVVTARYTPTPEDNCASVFTLWRGAPGGSAEARATYTANCNDFAQMTEAAGRVWLTFSTPETGREVFVLGRTAVSAEESPAAAALTLGAPTPNPSAGRTVLALASEAPVVVEAFDALGRRVALLHDGPAAGEVVFDTSRLPAGVYVVRARSVSGVASRRVVVR